MSKIILTGLFLLLSLHSFATIYYVRPTGSNTNPGTSPTSAWYDLTNVNTTRFVAGDIICLEQGYSYLGSIYFDPSDGGTSGNPVTITSWNPAGALTGRATINAGSSYGFYGYNTAGVKITDLNFYGSNSRENGVNFFCDLPDNAKKDFIRVENLEVKGFKTGVSIGSWNQNAGFSNVTITNVESHDNLTTGIFTYAQGRLAHANVNISYCKAYNNFGDVNNTTTNTGSGIILSGVDGGNINHCIAYNNGQNNRNPGGGPVGIWCYEANNIVIEHNESYNNKAGLTADGGGFDIDGGSTNCIMQYNYSHGNEGAGYLFAQFSGASAMSNNIARYNISENDGRKNGYGAITLWSAGGYRMDNTQIYGNTLYVSPAATGSPSGIYVISGTTTGNTNIRNNIIVTTGGLRLVNAPSTSGLAFGGNAYWSSGSAFTLNWGGTNYTSLSGFKTTGQESGTGIQADPLLNNPNAGITIGNTNELASLTAYQLKTGSPAIGAGVAITSPGSRDYFGNPLGQGTPFSIGAHQVNPPAGCSATGGIVREYWSNVSGTSISTTLLNAAPTGTTTVTSLEGPTNWGDNYQSRIRALITPVATGSYTFYIAGDDNSELWLSTNDNPANKVKIASVSCWTNPRQWDKDLSTQRAAAIALTVGTKYYVEILHKEGGGGDNVAVGWTGPGIAAITVIPASVLCPYAATLPAFSGTYKVTARHSSKALDVTGSSTAEGANVQQWTDNGTAAQQWVVTATTDGYYKLVNPGSNKALEVAGSGTADGSNVQQWSYTGASHQQWKLEATTDGFYRILNRHSGKALDVSGVSASDGANVHQWTYLGGSNQQWKLEQIATTSVRTAGAGAAGSRRTSKLSLRVHPNPASREVTISLAGFEGESAVQVSMRDLAGKAFLRRPVQPGAQEVTLPVGHLPRGVFVVTVQGSKTGKTAKLVITR